VALPQDLFIKLLDLDLWDAVVTGQQDNSTALEAFDHLQDSVTQPTKWRLEEGPNTSKCLFYDSKMYVPDDLEFWRKIVSDHHDILVAGHSGSLAMRGVAVFRIGGQE
jgi:hypothetical protein